VQGLIVAAGEVTLRCLKSMDPKRIPAEFRQKSICGSFGPTPDSLLSRPEAFSRRYSTINAQHAKKTAAQKRAYSERLKKIWVSGKKRRSNCLLVLGNVEI